MSNPLETAYGILNHYKKPHTIAHSKAVGDQILKLAKRYGLDDAKCEVAAALHDISVIIPPDKRLDAAEAWGIPILPEERRFSLLLHQKLSAKIAEEMCGITDAEVLSAIQCHTTLKANAKELDLLLFIADKVAWDGQGTPPWAEALEQGLSRSLRSGALAYIDYILNSGDILIPHPWLIAARDDLMPSI